MEKKICKKCGDELPEDHKGARCDECKVKRMRRIKKVGLAVGAALFMAGVIFAVARTKTDEDSENSEYDGSADDESDVANSDYLHSESHPEPTRENSPYTPEIGDIVRVGRGSIPWTVSYVSDLSGIVVLFSSESSIQRSEMPWNLKPFE